MSVPAGSSIAADPGCAVAVARYRGAAQVTAVDVAADRLDLALAAGADEACVPDDLAGEFDVVIELSGAPSSVALGLAHAALGAVIVLAGSVTPGPPARPARTSRPADRSATPIAGPPQPPGAPAGC